MRKSQAGLQFDQYRQDRNALQYLRGIKCPVLIVGGWNDEQNLYGIVNSYRTINEQNPDCDCRVVIGPWAHSGQKRPEGTMKVGDVYYGEQIAERYQAGTEFAFFEHHLKGEPTLELPEATVFDTGTKEWLKQNSLR